MSGGSLDYACHKVEHIADMIKERATKPEHLAFMRHLYNVAEALHDLEWVWSGDYGDGNEMKAIMTVITPSDVLESAVEDAKKAMSELDYAIKNTGRIALLNERK